MLNLDPRLYVGADVHERERHAIFARTWQLAGPASALAEPGSYTAIEIAGMKVFALRGRDGVLRAFRNVCRHRGAALFAEGTGRCNGVRCPYHQWVYDDGGALLNAPWFGEEPGFDPARWPLEPVHVAEWRGLAFVAVDPAASLEEQLGELPGELADEPIENYTAMASERVGFDCNWKIYTDNFVEGYHIPGVHPAFFRAIDFSAFETTAHAGFVRMTAPPRDGLFYRGKWLWMWPNWTLSLFEGGMNTSRIDPVSVARTEQIYHFHFADTSEAGAAKRADTVSRNLAVVREDYEVCVSTHRNYASGSYRAGPLSPRHEKGVRYFQQCVAEALAAA